MQYRFSLRSINAGTKGKLKQMRRSGQIPVSVQHRATETLHFQTEAKPLDDFVRQYGEAAMIELEDESGTVRRALVHDVQRDRISQHLLQVTFQSVEGDEQVKVHVPLRFQGVPSVVKERLATIQHAIEQVEVRCRPDKIPDHIVVDVSGMSPQSPLRIGDLVVGEGYEILNDGDMVVASLSVLHLATGVDAEAEPAPAS